MPSFRLFFTKAFLFCLCIPVHSVLATEGYYSSPTAHSGRLVFSSEGDLWRLDPDASQAIRLTTHAELESDASFSPDGEQLAFVASFNGTAQVYVMSVAGGSPEQLTFESVAVSVRGWSPDGRILYTSRNMEGSSRVLELRLVDPRSGAIERIELRYATTGTFDDSGRNLFFTRHGMSTVSDNARLYRGGGTSQLWRFELGSDAEAIRLAPDFEGPIETPMFWQDRLYFISDSSGYDNIWSMSTTGTDIRRHSNFSNWRLLDASLQNGIIHYQRGADIYAYDLASNSEELINIDLATDEQRSKRRWIDTPLQYFSGASLASGGGRVALTARGALTVTGTNARRRVDILLPGEGRARSARLDSKAEQAYAIVDRQERGEIWRFATDGSSSEQLTTNADAHRWELAISGDDQWLIHHDKKARLWKLNLQTGENSQILARPGPEDNAFRDIQFSSDNRYLVFTTTSTRRNGSTVWAHDLQEGNNVQLTDDKYVSYAPAFSRDGDWLYFLSERVFDPTPGSPWGDRNMGVQFDNRVGIYALKLNPASRFGFQAPDELHPAGAEKTDSEAEQPANDNPGFTIDWAQASQNIYTVPLAPGNYSSLQVNDERLYYLSREGKESALYSLAISNDSSEPELFAKAVAGFQLATSADTLLLQYSGASPSFALVPTGAKAPEDLADYRLRTQGWRLAVDPVSEWSQLFLDGWRLHRDFAFDPRMRGVDWEAVRDRLLPLASRIGHRQELANLFTQMAHEIGILHSQVRDGDSPRDDENGQLSSLGARYARANDGLEIVQIYQGETELPDSLGPLSQPGIDINSGDIIVAINRQAITNRAELAQALMYQAGEQVLLETRRGETTYEHIVVPVSLSDEGMLRYRDWILGKARMVADTSDGEIGYLHLRAMGSADVAHFAREYFAQNHLDGLIIDVRDNNGGNVDSIILQQLLRKVWSFWGNAEGTPSYGYNMQEAFRGHLAVLINAGTYSDGETFAAGIKALELAPLIGERTAGAGIWLADRNRLADGGISRVAESAQFGLDGRWLIEGRGISPDIEVVAEPHRLFKGEDQQLQAAIEYLQNRIAEQPVTSLQADPLPPVGEYGQGISDQGLNRN